MKKIYPYLIIFIIWMLLSTMGNIYTSYDNNLELNVGRISECFKTNEIYLYTLNKNKDNINLEYNVKITTTKSTYDYTLSFNGNKKKYYETLKYQGDLVSISVNDKLISYENAKIYKNKLLTFILRYSLISLILCFIIISIIINTYKINKKKYMELNSIKKDIQEIKAQNM